MCWGGGPDVESRGRGVRAGPGEERRDREGPARGMAGVLAGDGLGVPTAPGTDGGQRGAGDSQGSSAHAAEAVPSEGGPGGPGKEGMEGLLEVLLGWGKGATCRSGSGGERGEALGPGSGPRAQGGIDPSAPDLLIEEGQGGGLKGVGADAGSFPNAEELGEGEEGKAGGAGLSRGVRFVGEEEEQVRGGPQLDGGRGSEGLEGASHGPVEGGDSDWEEVQGLKLADGREETAGSRGGAGVKGHVMKGGSEDLGMGEGWVAGMEQGKRPQMCEICGGGTRGPGADGCCKGVEGVGLRRGRAEGITNEGKVGARDLRVGIRGRCWLRGDG